MFFRFSRWRLNCRLINIVCCLLFGISVSNYSFAQTAAVVSGGIGSGINGEVSYSVGQVVYHSQSNLSTTSYEGVQQPFEFYSISSSGSSSISMKLSAYPNPSKSVAMLRVENSLFNQLEYKLFDAAGRLLSQHSITQIDTEIPVGHLPAAVYFISVFNQSQLLKTIKIIKNN